MNQMKYKFGLPVLTLGLIMASCGNDTSDNSVPSSPNTPGVQNVNGSVPDTSNTINLNSKLPVDSSRIDSLDNPKP
jgi:hypothetical protein